MLLYRTIMGSRLYGTHREDSDFDYIEVYSSMYTKPEQTIVGQDDTTRVSLSTFVQLASQGNHQFLEAMFAPKSEIDMFHDMRKNFYPDTIKTAILYSGVIRKFGDSRGRRKEKAIKTAYIMTYQLEELLQRGRFDPTLDPATAAVLRSMTYTEAATATAARMHLLADTYGL